MCKEEDQKRLFISFSGGETSAYMTKWCLENYKDVYDEIVVVFANTGQENEETLEFVRNCDEEFGFNTIWVEGVVNPQLGKGVDFKIVDFESADRSGKVFEDAIAKYGIFNQAFPNCTSRLKLTPMTKYMRHIGWKSKTYDTAVGIRTDEIDRISKNYKENRIVYPLISDNPMSKPDINAFWSKQSFRLQLKGYQGNCKWCWKKSLRKHMTIIEESPEVYNFPREMESKYGVDKKGHQRTFFRNNLSVEDLFELQKEGNYKKAEDDSIIVSDKFGDVDIDQAGACSESCEVDFDEIVEDDYAD